MYTRFFSGKQLGKQDRGQPNSNLLPLPPHPGAGECGMLDGPGEQKTPDSHVLGCDCSPSLGGRSGRPALCELLTTVKMSLEMTGVERINLHGHLSSLGLLAAGQN